MVYVKIDTIAFIKSGNLLKRANGYTASAMRAFLDLTIYPAYMHVLVADHPQ